MNAGVDVIDRAGRTGRLAAALAAALLGAGAAQAAGPFINELHYDNAGADTGEFFEIAGPAGTDLAGYEVQLYNGATSEVYATVALGGVLADQGGGLGTLAFSRAGIQNGSPDGLALVGPGNVVLEFLSYEGSFEAASGAASGIVSVDIGVSEPSSTPQGASLQLTGSGCAAADFAWSGPAGASPGSLNAGQTALDCTTGGDRAPFVVTTVPAAGDAGVDPAADLTVTFSEDVEVSGAWFALACESSGSLGAAADAGPRTFTLDPAADLPAGDACELIVRAAGVSDLDGAPDALVGDVSVTFRTGLSLGSCGDPATSVGAVQGSGASAALAGQQVVLEGTVVGDFEGADPRLGGFYLQDAGDGDAATSDGIFVFDAGADEVALGDRVRVLGTVDEFFGQTQIDELGGITRCGAGALPVPAVVPVPVPAAAGGVDHLERYEGMLVTFAEPLVVTELFQLGRFGQLTLSAGERLPQPTAVVEPGAQAIALGAENARNRIVLDDELNAQNAFPVRFPTPDGLSPDNTVRGGDLVDGVLGVMTWTWGGNAASPNAWRVRPVADPVFVPANARPDAAPEVGGRVRVASFNVLNYFTTLDDGTARCGVQSPPQRCRGADNDEELGRQRAKLLSALVGLDADVVGLVELENNYAPDFAASAAQDLADGLNAAGGSASCADYRAVDPGGHVGGDVIAVGFLYCADRVEIAPGSAPAVLDDAVVRDAGLLPADSLPVFDGEATNRASLAVTFTELASGASFGIAVNHFKSKGASGLDDACDAAGPGSDPDCDQGDGQGFWNARRTRGAQALAAWLETDPTGAAVSGWLVVGDINAYANEDPVRAIEDAGYTNLVERFADAEPPYSFVFDGQWGYLDHALADAALLPAVTGAAEWHINADEPGALDYDTRFNDPSLYAADAFRASDHDPLVVGLNPGALAGDLDGDGRVGGRDYLLVRRAVGAREGDAGYDRRADLDGDGAVTRSDLRAWLRLLAASR